MKRLRSLLLENVPYKALSVLIAMALWFIVQDEHVEEIFEIALDVQTAPEVVVSNEIVPELSVGVSGTRAALDRLRRNPIQHPVKLTSREPGLVTVRVRPDDLRLPGGMSAFHVSPSTTTLRLEGKATRRIPVRPRVVLEAAESDWRIKKISVTPERVRVAGPASVISGLDEVWTEVIAVRPRGGEAVIGTHPVSLPHRQLRLEEAAPVTVRIEFEPAMRANPAPTPDVSPAAAASPEPPEGSGRKSQGGSGPGDVVVGGRAGR